MKNRTNKESLF